MGYFFLAVMVASFVVVTAYNIATNKPADYYSKRSAARKAQRRELRAARRNR